jgi:hypothetical protein
MLKRRLLSSRSGKGHSCCLFRSGILDAMKSEQREGYLP